MAPGNVTAEVKPYKVSNYPSHDSSFFGELVSGRVWVFENPELKGYANVPHAELFQANGRHLRCTGHKTGGGKLHWVETETSRWEVDHKLEASLVNVFKQKKPGFRFFFYDPKTGTLAIELASHGKDGEVTWTRPDAGWVQDSWPRLFADGCPGIELPAGMAVNEKQTSSSLRDLREQDPDAVIRHFPGSELTGPGRVGVAAHDVPTTAKEEVWAFLDGQEGNVMLGPQGHGRVFVRGADGSRTHEVWGLKDEGDFAWTASLEEREESGHEWLVWTFNGKVVHRYRMGDPLPYPPDRLPPRGVPVDRPPDRGGRTRGAALDAIRVEGLHLPGRRHGAGPPGEWRPGPHRAVALVAGPPLDRDRRQPRVAGLGRGGGAARHDEAEALDTGRRPAHRGGLGRARDERHGQVRGRP